MAMWLARPAVITRVEEGEQTPLLVILRPHLQTRVRRLQIILVQHVCLLLVCLSREDEVACDDGELVEDEEVRWRRGGNVDDVQVWRRVVEGIEVFFGRRRGRFEFGEGLFCQRGTVPQLELCCMLAAVGRCSGAFGTGTLAGRPVEVRTMERSVGENRRLDDAFAVWNLASTKRGSESGRPKIIFLNM